MPPENCTSALQGAMDVGEILVGSCAVLLGVCCWANVADVSCLMHHSFLGNLRGNPWELINHQKHVTCLDVQVSNVFPYSLKSWFFWYRRTAFTWSPFYGVLVGWGLLWPRHVCEEQRCAIFAREAQGSDQMIGFWNRMATLSPIFFSFTPIWGGNDPIWLIFFKGLKPPTSYPFSHNHGSGKLLFLNGSLLLLTVQKSGDHHLGCKIPCR